LPVAWATITHAAFAPLVLPHVRMTSDGKGKNVESLEF
jgi:hypothetical protein